MMKTNLYICTFKRVLHQREQMVSKFLKMNQNLGGGAQGQKCACTILGVVRNKLKGYRITWSWRKKWNLLSFNFFHGNAFLNIIILYYLRMRRNVWFENHLFYRKNPFTYFTHLLTSFTLPIFSKTKQNKKQTNNNNKMEVVSLWYKYRCKLLIKLPPMNNKGEQNLSWNVYYLIQNLTRKCMRESTWTQHFVFRVSF